MKKIVLTLALAALSIPALALAAEPAPKSSMQEVCSNLAELARLTMEARQVGAPMRTMMAVAVDTVMADIVTEAYGTPAFTTQKNQDRAIQEFEDKWFLRCVKSYNQ